jgi:hypothetical protein
LHITFGNINNEKFTISSSVVVNGHRTIVDADEYLNGVKKYINPIKNQNTFKHLNTIKNSLYILNVDINNICIDKSWMDNVTKHQDLSFKNIYNKEGFFDSFNYDNIMRNSQRPFYNSLKQNNRVDVNENPCETCIFKKYKIDLMEDEIEKFDQYMEEYDEYVEECEEEDTWEKYIKRKDDEIENKLNELKRRDFE